MKGKCTRCKAKQSVMKYKGSVLCGDCAPELSKNDEGVTLGIGLRFRTLKNGQRELKGNKGDRNYNKKHKMRTNLGMNYATIKKS